MSRPVCSYLNTEENGSSIMYTLKDETHSPQIIFLAPTKQSKDKKVKILIKGVFKNIYDTFHVLEIKYI